MTNAPRQIVFRCIYLFGVSFVFILHSSSKGEVGIPTQISWTNKQYTLVFTLSMIVWRHVGDTQWPGSQVNKLLRTDAPFKQTSKYLFM